MMHIHIPTRATTSRLGHMMHMSSDHSVVRLMCQHVTYHLVSSGTKWYRDLRYASPQD